MFALTKDAPYGEGKGGTAGFPVPWGAGLFISIEIRSLNKCQET